MLDDLAKAIQDVKEANQNYDVQIATLTSDKQSLQMSIDRLNIAVNSLNDVIAGASRDKAALQATIDQLKANPHITSEQIKAQRIIGVAMNFMYQKIPYVFGGNWDTTKTFDCSGYTQICYKIAAGIALPRTSRSQADVGIEVKFEDMQPADLIFYDFNKDGDISHVAMYMGSDKMIHTNTPATGINIQNSTWNKGSIVSIRRPLSQ